MNAKKAWIAAGIMLSGLIFMVGCSNQNSTAAKNSGGDAKAPGHVVESATSATPNAGTNGEEHGHKPGAHGGIMVSLGRDSYHAEAVFEKGGVLRLYLLGQDESRVVDIEKQTLRGFVKAEGDTEAQPFSLEPEPQDGDAEGRTSSFAGKLPAGLAGRKLEVTIPNLAISGERFRLAFQSNMSVPHDEPMPKKVESAEAKSLYSTPGGKYTEEDIKANGTVAAAVKFQGILSAHNLKPLSGDRICPVTLTKANPEFSWIIGGKTYQFCCPPCIDEFIKTAKSAPQDIQDPEFYVKP